MNFLRLLAPRSALLLSSCALAGACAVSCSAGETAEPIDYGGTPGQDAGGGSGGEGGTSSGGSGGATGGSGGATGGSGGATGGSAGQSDAGDDGSVDAGPDAPSETGSDTGGLLGLGETCVSNPECASNYCVEVGQPSHPLRACVRPCLSAVPCPDGTRCTTVPGIGQVCAPFRDSPCAACETDTDCRTLGDRCLDGPAGDKFCGVDCSFDSSCPTGLECQTIDSKKLCVPAGGESCPCAPNRDGTKRSCEYQQGTVTCSLLETCNGSQAAYEGCAPGVETCNGLDDDCNGTVDDFPNATCQCAGGSCTLECTAGWAVYPPSVPEIEGCPCKTDSYGDACASPHNIGAVTESGGTPTRTVTGTLSSDTDVDWFSVTFTDAAESGLNTLRPSIELTSNPGGEFVFVTGADCATAGAAPTLTSADSCFNYYDAASKTGLSPCGVAAGMNHCDPVSRTRVIGVKRNPNAAAKTCASYELTVKAAGTCSASTFNACAW